MGRASADRGSWNETDSVRTGPTRLTGVGGQSLGCYLEAAGVLTGVGAEDVVAPISGHSVKNVRPMLDTHCLHRDARLAGSGIAELIASVAALASPANDVAIGAAPAAASSRRLHGQRTRRQAWGRQRRIGPQTRPVQ